MFFVVRDRLIFTVLGTDYDQWVVGYDCQTGKRKRKQTFSFFFVELMYKKQFLAEVVLQTRKGNIKRKYLKEAYAVLEANHLPMGDMVCETGYGKPKHKKKHQK